MKYLLLPFLCIFFGINSIAQNDLVVFSEDGKAFFLYVNGTQQNDAAATNVKARGITNGAAAVRVVFEDNSAPDIKKNMAFMEKNTEVTAKITLTKKGYRLKYFGESPIKGNAPEIAEDKVEFEVSEDSYEVVEESPSSDRIDSEEVITTTTTVTTNEVPSGESVEMGININGFEMNVDVNVSDESEMRTTQTTTTETTISNSMTTSKLDQEVVIEEDISELDMRCPLIMNDISRLKQLLKAEDFSDDKINVAKQALRKHCISTNSILELAPLFDFEDDKLEFVKYCYDKTVDQENFYLVNSVFDFSSTKDELNEFLESK